MGEAVYFSGSGRFFHFWKMEYEIARIVAKESTNCE